MKTLRKKAKVFRNWALVVTVVALLFLVIIVAMVFQLIKKNKEISKLTEKNIELQELQRVNDLYKDQMSAVADLVQGLDNCIIELDQANRELEIKYNSLVTLLNHYQKREELYNKYEWALIYDGNRTDIEYESILTLEKMAADNRYGTDAVALTLALAIQESHGIADAKSSTSTATGLGQLIYSTAKYSYEKLLGNGDDTYKREYAFDPNTNLQMALAYINAIAHDPNVNGDPIKVIDQYRGLHSPAYIEGVRKLLDRAGLELDCIELY